MKQSSVFILIVSLLAAFGSWLMQQPATFTWAQTFAPINFGSLLVAVTGVLLAAFGVRTKGGAE